MKAAIYTEYGAPDVLRIMEAPKPAPEEGEVLIKIHAASFNSMDWDMLTGKPAIYRLLFGIMSPKHNIPGCDVAGVVEAVGPGVEQLSPGDRVYGDISGDMTFGAFAEYVCGKEKCLAPIPGGMTFEQAAAIPQAGILVLVGLGYNGGVQPGQKVLFNGAGGGAGTIAIQLAKAMGAEVTGVDSAAKLDAVRAAGADHAIDYEKEDFTRNGQTYDLIIDVVMNRSIFDYKRSLSPGGAFGVVGGKISRILETVVLGPLIARLAKVKMGIVAHDPSTENLAKLNELFKAGKFKPVIDKCFSLDDIAEAYRHFETGQFMGKIVITMTGDNQPDPAGDNA